MADSKPDESSKPAAARARSSKFYARTRIEHGAVVDGENKVLVFEEDQPVTGLDAKVMEELWNNGALYTRGTDDEVVSVDTSTSAGTAASPGLNPPPPPGLGSR